MDYITVGTKKKLQSVGFQFPEYEHFLNGGMVYAYDGDEYIIGCSSSAEFSEQDRLVSSGGVWLPDSEQLMKWLCERDCDVVIHYEPSKRYYFVRAQIGKEALFEGSGPDLANALSKVIFKICRAGFEKKSEEE